MRRCPASVSLRVLHEVRRERHDAVFLVRPNSVGVAVSIVPALFHLVTRKQVVHDDVMMWPAVLLAHLRHHHPLRARQPLLLASVVDPRKEVRHSPLRLVLVLRHMSIVIGRRHMETAFPEVALHQCLEVPLAVLVVQLLLLRAALLIPLVPPLPPSPLGIGEIRHLQELCFLSKS